MLKGELLLIDYTKCKLLQLVCERKILSVVN